MVPATLAMATLMLQLLLGICALAALATPAAAQLETELIARRCFICDAGTGVRSVARDAAGRYYVLTAPGPAVLIYSADGKRTGQIPVKPTKENSIVFGDDLVLNSSGRLVVADRGANAIKVFSLDGELAPSEVEGPPLIFPIVAPTSIASLGEGELAVTTLRSDRLVTVFDSTGKILRAFGEPTQVATGTDRGLPTLNRFLNIGRLAADSAGHLYYAFSYLPEPTVRKYDRYGYASLEIELNALDLYPAAQATRREIERQSQNPGQSPQLKPILAAVAVDPATQEIWVAHGGLLIHFATDGSRRGLYRTYTPAGVRLEPSAILLEPDRLLLASDSLGIFDFPRPDKPAK